VIDVQYGVEKYEHQKSADSDCHNIKERFVDGVLHDLFVEGSEYIVSIDLGTEMHGK